MKDFKMMNIITLTILWIIGSTDSSGEFIGSANLYKQVDGVLTPEFSDYEGSMDLVSCVTLCGCKNNKNAAFDNTTNSCYCSDVAITPCDSSSCISVYDSSGISISIAAQTPLKTYVNSPFDVIVTSTGSINTFGLVINDRLAIYPSSTISSVIIGMPGNYSIEVDANAFYGCPSEIHQMVVEVKDVTCSFNASRQFKSQVNATFNMTLDLTGPDNLQQLKIQVFKDDIFSTSFAEYIYPNPSASIYLEIGGNSETNRLQSYTLTFDDKKRSAVIVSLNHLISSSGVITGFSAFVTKLGGIRFLILQTACEAYSGLKSCFLSRKCDLVSTKCAPVSNTYVPNSASDIFYPYYTVFGSTTLTPWTFPQIFFKVVYSFTVNATVIGQNDFVVPYNDRFTTTPGQFLAWMPDYSNDTPGDVAFNSIDPSSQFQSVHYNEIFDVYINQTFDNYWYTLTSLYEISNTEHMISLYLEVPSTYYIEQSADYPDGTDFTVKAFVTDSNGNEKILCIGKTSIVTDIKNLSLSTLDLSTNVLTDRVILFNVSGLGTAEASYAVYWDEFVTKKIGVYDEIFNTSELTHTFTKPGLFNVTVKAFTDLSFQITNLTLNVTCGLRNLSFFNTNEDPIRANGSINPVATSESQLSVDVSLTGCGLITINYFLESDTLQMNGSSALWLGESSIYDISTNIFQKLAQTINITICATNNLETECINDWGYIEDAIKNFDLVVTTMETNVSGLLNISKTTIGTNKTYCVDWGDGSSTCTNGTYDVPSINHTYTRSGNYSVFVLVFNRISRMNKTVQQEVQDRTYGCNIETKPTVYMTPTEIFYSIDNGTGIDIYLDWGDGKTKNVVYDMDISLNNSLISFQDILVGLRGFASFQYTVKQDYNICLSLINDISNASCCVIAIVEDEIKDLYIKLVQEYEGTNKTDWIEENETLYLTSEHNAEAKRVLFLVNLDNGTLFNTTSQLVNTSYSPWRLCYNYSVVATNPVSIESASKNLCVQRPLYAINSSRFVHVPTSSTNVMSIKLTFILGNYFDCFFNFSDGSAASIFFISYTDFIGPVGFIEANHQFLAGQYNVTLSCTNRLYDFFASTIVLSQDPVIKPYLDIKARCYNNSIVTDLALVRDINDMVMSADCNIFISVQDQSGSNVSVFGLLVIDGNSKGKFLAINNTIEIQKSYWSGSMIYMAKVCVNSTNNVSTDLTCSNIKLVTPVSSFRVKAGSGSVYTPISFTVTFQPPLPGNPCLSIDYKDGTPYQVFGGTNCNKPTGPINDPSTNTFSNTYKSPGIYSILFIAYNQVSSVSQIVLLRITDVPCYSPYIEIASSAASSEENLNSNQNFYKCKNTTFKYVMRRNCSRSNAILVRNIVIEYKVSNSTWSKVVDENLGERYILMGKSLNKYGVYRVNYIGQMVDNRTGDVIDSTTAVKKGYFKIVPCPLRIIIDGGYEKTVERGSDIIINATQSYDPDDDNAILNVKWFCAQSGNYNGTDLDSLKKIEYPTVDLATYTNVDFISKECFSNTEGPTQLNDKGLMGLKFVLKSSYLWYYCYDLRLKITKSMDQFSRQTIRDITVCLKDKEPLSVLVKCEQNCDALIDPNSKLSLSSSVSNKAKCSQISYNWMVLRTSLMEDNSNYEDITETINATTGFVMRNLVIKANSLNSAYKYKFRVNASCLSGELSGVSGAGAEIVYVNKPPDVSQATCKVFPDTGVAVQTDFVIVCTGVTDDQMPLSYAYQYNCNDTWSMISTARTISNLTFKLPPSKRTNGSCSLRVLARDSYGVLSDPFPMTPLEVQVADFDVGAKRNKRSIIDLPTQLCNNLTSDFALSSQFLISNYITVLLEMNSSMSYSCKISISLQLNTLWIDTPDDAIFVLQNVQTDANHSISLLAVENVIKNLSILSANELKEVSTLVLGKTSRLGGKSSMSFSLSLESIICSAVAQTLIIGEPSTESKTPFGLITIQQIEPGAKSIGSFDLPDLGGDGGGAINSVGSNRYQFDKASGNLKGNVKGLSLTNPDGTEKVVRNLTEKKIRLVIEYEESYPPMKNYTAYCELMRTVVPIEIKVNSSVIVLNITPMDDNFTGFFFLFMNKGTYPSLTDNQQNCSLPNDLPSNWDSLPKESQDYWEKEKKWTCYINEYKLNNTAVGVWVVGVLYYNDTHPLTKALLPQNAPPAEDNCSAVGYYFQAYSRACLYWDKKINTWNSEGCETIENETNSYQTVCACTHLTDFGGGGPIADAAPLDFGALKRFDLASNPTVFSVVMAIFGIYLILFVWARKKDKRDLEKNKVIFLPENHPDDKYLYEIVVETGFDFGASTSADVVIVLTGKDGESGPRRLYSLNRKCFQRSEVDVFIIAVPSCLGQLKEITIWHNNAGSFPGWFLMKVQVCDMQTQKKTDFLCNQWLDVAEDDGNIIRTLQPSTLEEVTEFKYLFFVTLRRNLYEGHIWLSLFMKPAQSSFTTCQRLATCMSLLMTTMLANIMFYKTDSSPSTTITIGPLVFSINEIKISFTSALIVIPCNLLIVFLFKNSATKDQDNSTKYQLDEKKNDVKNSVEEDEEKLKAKHYNSQLKYIRSLFFYGKDDDIKAKNKLLPHWFIYIAYLIAFVTSIVSAIFVIMYGFTYGKIKSNKWMASMIFAFCFSVFLIQPIKIIALSIFFSVLRKVPSSNGKPSTLSKPDTEENESDKNLVNIVEDFNKFKLPEERRLNEFRVARLKEKRIKIIIKEVLVHLSFVLLVVIVAYSSADPSCFWLFQSAQQLSAKNGLALDYFQNKVPPHDMFQMYTGEDNKVPIPTGDGVGSNVDWFTWAKYGVIDYLFPNSWYNGDIKGYPKGFVADAASSKVLAMARFRQLRVTPNSCTKHPVFEYLISQCNAGYSASSEENQDFKAGWLPPLNLTERIRRRKGKRKATWKGLEDPWLYQTSTQLNSPFPFNGYFNTYPGSSYSVSIGPDRRTANKIIRELRKFFWVDRYTRALFTEINIYNANTNLMLIVTFLHEMLPTGGWHFYTNVQALRLYRYVGGLGQSVILFDLIFSAVTFIGLYKAIRASRKVGVKVYLSDPWNLLHVIVTGNSILAIIFTLGRMLAVNAAVADYTSDPELFVSFQYVGQLEYLIIGCLGFILFFTNLEFLRILRFNRLIAMLCKSVVVMASPLLGFGLMFIVLFMAFVSFTNCIYVDKLEDFQSVTSSFVAMTQMFLGKLSVSDYFNNAPVFGPIMFASYMLSIQMVMINLFVGLICDSFAEVGEQETEEEPSVVGFIFDRVKKPGNEPEPIYSEWRDEWEQTIFDLESGCDNCTYVLRNMEADELRQKKFFEEEDELKKELLVAVLGLDFYTSEVEFCDGLSSLEKKLLNMTSEDAKLFLKQAAAKRLLSLQQENMQDQK
nr:uncharacterized protein LOC100197078 [Hydra vulgaris]